VAQTLEFGQQLSFGAVGEPYRTPYHTPSSVLHSVLPPGPPGPRLTVSASNVWYLANHPPQPSGVNIQDGFQGDPMWFMVQTSAQQIVEFSTDGGVTWVTYLAHSTIGQFYSDGQNWRINNDGTTDETGSIVYPIDII
jgi:hypothetical protein